MIVTPVKTKKIPAGEYRLTDVIVEHLSDISEGSVLVVTSKIVSLCEGSVVLADRASREALIADQSELYLPPFADAHNYHLTYKNFTLVGSAGIDHSNGAGYYVLWPRNAQQTANEIRAFLCQQYGLQNVGVVIADSASQPMRLGAIGIALAHSGFAATRKYAGTDDLFGDKFVFEQANISGGIAAAAVLAMGEGAEQTPLCVVSDIPGIDFQDHDPIEDELKEIHLTLESDLYAPLWAMANWRRGGGLKGKDLQE